MMPDPANTAYKRSQVDGCLWKLMLQGRPGPEQPPKVFLTRIKRLLELDREATLADRDRVPDVGCAFVDELPGGQGVDTAYRPFNVFCLALGLELLDLGFKQSEIVFLLRYIRDDLEREFRRIVRSSPPLPSAPGGRGRSVTADDHADHRVFMVLRKVELTEIFSVETRNFLKGKPLMPYPEFCLGLDHLARTLDRMELESRKAVVIELANTVTLIMHLLPRAVVKKRGRSKGA